jgi:RNA polymerase sigma-70 factor (ECF subfamily)
VDKTTRDLIIKAQAGDTESFHEIVAIYDTRIMTLTLQIAQNKEDAEDIYQETFVKVFKNISKFRFESDIYTWIYRIAVNTAYNYKRKQSKMIVVEPKEENGYDFLDWIYDPQSNEDNREELIMAINQSLLTLSHQQRTVFILKHLQQLKIKDIANILDLSDGTVKKYLFRAMKKLRVSLKEYHYA